MYFLSETHLAQKNGMSASVSTKDWLKFICLGFLNAIPLVGPFIYIGVLIYLAASDKIADSIKSFVKASFIFAGIGLAISLVLIFVAMAFVGSSLWSLAAGL